MEYWEKKVVRLVGLQLVSITPLLQHSILISLLASNDFDNIDPS